MANHDHPVVHLRRASKRREQGGIKFELSIPELTIHKGEFVAIVGDSGCGKSTLLDLLALVSRPSECEQFDYHLGGQDAPAANHDILALWNGDNETALAHIRKSGIGYVLQTGGLLPFLTVEQNITLPSRLNGFADNSAYTQELALGLGIEQVLNKKPQFLSGGQRQRTAILRAIHHRPRVIFADEPTAAVDKPRARTIVEDFARLAAEHDTIIVMVTHDHGLIEGIADLVYGFDVEQRSASETFSTVVRREVSIP